MEQIPNERDDFTEREMSRGLEFHLARALAGNIYPDEIPVVRQMLIEEGFSSELEKYTLVVGERRINNVK